jgi:hypothetical protein
LINRPPVIPPVVPPTTPPVLPTPVPPAASTSAPVVKEDSVTSIFEKCGDNTFRLQTGSTNLNEARKLEPDQEKVLNDFLDDLSIMFGLSRKATPEGRKKVIPFLQSQGSRFKYILDYLSKYNVIDPTVAVPRVDVTGLGSATSTDTSADAGTVTRGTPSVGVSSAPSAAPTVGVTTPVDPTATVTPTTPVKLSPNFVTQIAAAKQNPLVKTPILPRIQKLTKINANNATDIKYLKTLLNLIKNAVTSPSNKALIQKQLGGDVSKLKNAMLEEAITSVDITSMVKDINALMPILVKLAFELRQVTNKKNPNAIKEADAPQTKELTVNDLKLVKVFLSRLVDLSTALNTFDPNKATRATLKPIISNILDIFDLTNGKLGTGKVNKNIDAAFQGLDILGPISAPQSAGDNKTTGSEEKKNGPVIIMNGRIYKRGNGEWFYYGSKNNPFDADKAEKVVAQKIIDTLNDFAKDGRDDSSELSSILKKVEKDKTLSAADATKAKAEPKSGKDIAKKGEPLSFDKSRYEESVGKYKDYF